MRFRHAVFIGSLIVLFGLFLRLANLNSLPIFADEAIYVRWSQVMRAEPSLHFLPLSDGKQPLFMWATIPFFKVIADPLVAARTLSVLTGLGTIVGVGVASFLLFNSLPQSLMAMFVAAVLPYSLFFDRLALADSMLCMFLLWGFVFFYLSISKLRLDMALLAGFCFGFAWLTKSPAIIGLLLLPTIFLCRPKYSIKSFFVACGLWLVVCALAGGMYNILRLGPEFHMIALRNKDYVIPFTEVLRHPLDPLKPHLLDAFHFYFYFLTPLGLLLSVLGIIINRYHLRVRLILLSWWLIPVVAQSAIAVAFTARYLLFTVPFVVMLIAYGLYYVGERKRLLTYCFLALFTSVAIWFDFLQITNPVEAFLPRIERQGYLEEWTAGQGIGDIASLLRTYATQGSPIVVGSEGFFGTPFNALQLYLNDVPSIRIVGVGVYVTAVDDKLTSALGENQVYLVVNASRFHADPDKLGLQLIATYPKATRPDGTQDQLLFFRVTK